MLTVAVFQATFPEFVKTAPTLIELTIARCVRQVSPQVWCEQTDDGVGLLTAHRLKQMSAGTTTAARPVPTPPDGEDYGTTSYGREFRALRDSICGGFVGGGTWTGRGYGGGCW